ncbi:EAL and HDOD domain-containing protein [Legionella spiritensis]|uniref:Signal transduction protein n=1 Tax=Legionella spiritensis TaxID=452 RepID=A0A0W0Z6C3_LEGSP|nr:HDOD domain-containing protein [Legionella spiritensis]KTD64688.1 signal transduction protein [Legionella spiritensis]SNV47889.1 signal transduction protein [Legionella spiritensis]
MLIKRPIYNQQLKCVALEIIANDQEKEPQELLQPFTTIIRNADASLPLFVPYALRTLVELPEPPLENPIILKLHAADINQLYPIDELQNSLYSIALMIDDPKQLAWLNFAEYIALSEHLMAMADVTRVVKYSQAKQRKVIAYGIANINCFDQCKGLTMDYYCGDFLFQPHKQDTREIAANKLNLLTLIDKLQHSQVNLDDIIELIQTDPLLSYQLLKIANSAAFSGYQAVKSIQQAVTRLGIIHLKNWVMVLSMKNVSDKPVEIVESGLIRAQMAQKLAHANQNLCEQSAYTTGLLSVLDSLLDSPMSVLIDKITLADEIKMALLSREGALGELLSTVIAYEEGHWEALNGDEYCGMDLSQVYIACLEQVSFGKKAMTGM